MLDNEVKNIGGFQFKTINLSTTPVDYNEEVRNGVIRYGVNNDFPQYLLDLLNKSTNHSAIVKNKVAMIGGNGFDKSTLSDDAKLFLRNAYGKNNCEEILAMIAEDLTIYNGFALKVSYSNDKSIIAKIDYVDPYTLRLEEPKPEFPDVEGFYISDDWSHYRPKKIWYPEFNPKIRNNGSQILYVRGSKKQGTNKYPTPEYFSAIKSIISDYEIVSYHLDNIQNGFQPNLIINFRTGIPSPEEMEKAVHRLNKEFTGALGKKYIFVFSEDNNGPEITPIESNDSDKKYENLRQSIQDNIFVGHQVNNPALMGIRVPGELGNTNNLPQDLSTFQSMYISPKQKLIEDTFNKLAKVNGITDKFTIQQYEMDVKVQTSIGDLLSVLTSACPEKQKQQILEAAGYSTKEAADLVNSGMVPQENNPIQNG